jgi:C1A family cysteine protease
MKNHKRMPGALMLILLLIIVPVMGSVDSSGQSVLTGHSLSPVNPRFTRFITEAPTPQMDYTPASAGALGLVPTTVDLSFSTGTRISNFGTRTSTLNRYSTVSSSLDDLSSATEVTMANLPGRFDLRTIGKVSTVKNQGQCGSCWAFSTLASLESALLGSESWDFSENNMRNSHGFDISSCQGGNAMMATAYLARWSGVLEESGDPYSTDSRSAVSTTYPNAEAVKHVQEILFIPDRSSALDNENIKRTLSEKGAFYSTIRWEDSAYRSSTASYYYKGSSQPNHAITIVGWDDSYDRNRFTTKPSGNGAFIVKNSWGSNWGEKGYFYVSYYDTWIGKNNAFFSAEESGNYDHIYQYDPLGWVVSYGEKSETAYFANVFTAQSAEDLTAVSFYTAAPDSRYQFSVYKGVQNSPVSGSPVITESGTIGVPGYHTIPLSSAVALQYGERFSVVVKLTTPGYTYPVALEYPLNGFSARARASGGQSFVSSSGTTWTDLNSIFPNTNVCLKAFTNQASFNPILIPVPTAPGAESDTTAPVVTITTPASSGSSPAISVIPGSSVQVTWSATDTVDVAGVDISYSKDQGETWTTAASKLAMAGTYVLIVPTDISGTFMIRVTAEDSAGNEGSSTVTCTVTSSSQGRSVEVRNPSRLPVVRITSSFTLGTSPSADTNLRAVSGETPGSYPSVAPVRTDTLKIQVPISTPRTFNKTFRIDSFSS